MKGIYGSHTGERSLAYKAFTQASGRACKNKPKSFLRNVISVKDLLLASISPEEFLTQYQVPGHSWASP